MRLDASTLGLVAWLGGATASNGDSQYTVSPTLPTTTKLVSPNTVISFSYQTATPHIFHPRPSNVPQPLIQWSILKDGYRVRSATLYVNDNGKNKTVATSTPTWKKGTLNPAKPTQSADWPSDTSEDDKRDLGLLLWEKSSSEQSEQSPTPVGLPFSAPPGGKGSVTIDPVSYDGQNALVKKMYLAVDWLDPSDGPGTSWSTTFVASDQDPNSTSNQALTQLANELSANGDAPAYAEGPRGADVSSPGSQTLEPSLAGQFPTGAATDSPASAATNGVGGTAESHLEGNNGGDNSLNPGVIAGIVVGAVIGGLLIISALAYFLCFRRRSANKRGRHIHGDVGYASDSGAAGMIAREKDMPGVNHSPSDAYADDNGHLHNHGGLDHGNESTNYSNHDERGVPAGVGAHQQSRDSLAQNDYSLYNNSSNANQGVRSNRHSAIGMAVSGAGGAEQNSATESRRERTRSVGGVPAAGRTSHQTSRPGSEARSPSRYAHLIEEGMTEDEIRRLEDEERQLDAAIEDAGRHGAGGGGRPKK